MTGRQWMRHAEERLRGCGDLDARVDARWMLEAAVQPFPQHGWLGVLDGELDETTADKLGAWVARREAGEPLQYIVGYAVFMGLEFSVNPRVLIPRQDTETLCEAALRIIRPGMSVLDLCTGSGALAVAIKKRRPEARIVAADISPDALSVAQANAQRNAVDIALRCGDLFDAVAGERFDVIVCNPPYISDRDMLALQTEVRREPELARRGGPDGLVFYRRIAAAYRGYLNPGGALLLEVGYDQARAVAEMLGPGAFIERDLCGIERVVGICDPIHFI